MVVPRKARIDVVRFQEVCSVTAGLFVQDCSPAGPDGVRWQGSRLALVLEGACGLSDCPRPGLTCDPSHRFLLALLVSLNRDVNDDAEAVDLVGEGWRGGQRASVVHGKPTGARSASSTNPQPGVLSVRRRSCSLFHPGVHSPLFS